MGQTAYLRLEGATASSRKHNTREVIPDYVFQEKMSENKHYFFDQGLEIVLKPKQSHNELREELKKFYQENTGQKVQKRQNLLTEGLILFSSENTNEQILSAVKSFAEKYNLHLHELHIHRDEGHYDSEKKWNPNLHAHFVFSNLFMHDKIVKKKNKKGEDVQVNLKGKSLKFTPKETSEMQNHFAQALNLKLGKSKSREHLTHVQYKNKIAEEKAIDLKAQISSNLSLIEETEEKARKETERLKKIEKDINEAIEISKKILSGEKDVSRWSILSNPGELSELKSAIKLASLEIRDKQETIVKLSDGMRELLKKVEEKDNKIENLQRKIEDHLKSIQNLDKWRKDESGRAQKLEIELKKYKTRLPEIIWEKLQHNPDFKSEIVDTLSTFEKFNEMSSFVARKIVENRINLNNKYDYDFIFTELKNEYKFKLIDTVFDEIIDGGNDILKENTQRKRRL